MYEPTKTELKENLSQAIQNNPGAGKSGRPLLESLQGFAVLLSGDAHQRASDDILRSESRRTCNGPGANEKCLGFNQRVARLFLELESMLLRGFNGSCHGKPKPFWRTRVGTLRLHHPCNLEPWAVQYPVGSKGRRRESTWGGGGRKGARYCDAFRHLHVG